MYLRNNIFVVIIKSFFSRYFFECVICQRQYSCRFANKCFIVVVVYTLQHNECVNLKHHRENKECIIVSETWKLQHAIALGF